MEQIDISFCVPVYNVSAFLEACIDSIVTGAEGVGAEIICVDDCSTDGSWELLGVLAKKYSGMICMRNDENRGVSYSRNRALNTAKGKYVWFVDPDDLLCPGVVRPFFENAERARADIALGNYARVEEEFSLEGSPYTAGDTLSFKTSGCLPHPVDKNGRTMCAVWAGLIRTEFLRSSGLSFRENMIAQEDTLFYYEAEQRRPVVIKTDAVCYLYRTRKSSVMNRRSEERIEKYYLSMRIMLEVYLEYLDSGNYRDKEMLEEKIHRSYENVCACLAQCTDHAFVKKNLKELKALGYYPYPFRKAVFNQSSSKLKAMFDYLLPVEVCFWIAHFAFSLVNKIRFE